MKKNRTFDYLLPAFLSLAFLILIYTPLEFRITEIWLLTPQINKYIPTLILITLVLIFNFFNWEKILSKGRIVIFLFILIFGFSCFVYYDYRNDKLSLEYLPKIYKISNLWGIQGTVIKIDGVNFLPAWEKGKVLLGEEEFHIKSWDDKSIIVEQPVMSRFGNFELYLIRADGLISNKVLFLVRDPKELSL
jgi:hypothetical protein